MTKVIGNDCPSVMVENLISQHNLLLSQLKTLINGTYILTSTGLSMGSTKTNIANVDFTYVINGKTYRKAAVAAGTAPGSGTITQNKYGVIALDIDGSGTITAVTPSSTQAYNSASEAVAALPAVASNKVRMGYVTVIHTGGDFTIGTTNFDATGVTANFVSYGLPETLSGYWNTISTADSLNKG